MSAGGGGRGGGGGVGGDDSLDTGTGKKIKAVTVKRNLPPPICPKTVNMWHQTGGPKKA